MTAFQLECLLREIAAAAQAGADLPGRLRACGLAGAPALAEALERGVALPAALAAQAGPEPLELLVGPRPTLEQAALLLAGRLQERRERRRERLLLLLPPVVGVVAAGAALAFAAGGLGLRADWRWLPAALAAALVAALPAVGLLGERVAVRLPWLAGWALHGERAWRYERAALAARWRLDEATLARLGTDVVALGPVLARPDAEGHCRRLAAWHRDSAARARRRVALITALGLHLVAAALVLAAAGGAVQQLYDTVGAWAVVPE